MDRLPRSNDADGAAVFQFPVGEGRRKSARPDQVGSMDYTNLSTRQYHASYICNVVWKTWLVSV